MNIAGHSVFLTNVVSSLTVPSGFLRLHNWIPDSAGDDFCPQSRPAPIFNQTQTERRLHHFSFPRFRPCGRQPAIGVAQENQDDLELVPSRESVEKIVVEHALNDFGKRMSDANEMALVLEYATGNSEPAIETLVRRHVSLVYSVALRQFGNPAQAEGISGLNDNSYTEWHFPRG